MTPPLVGRRLIAFGDDYADKKDKGKLIYQDMGAR